MYVENGYLSIIASLTQILGHGWISRWRIHLCAGCFVLLKYHELIRNTKLVYLPRSPDVVGFASFKASMTGVALASLLDISSNKLNPNIQSTP